MALDQDIGGGRGVLNAVQQAQFFLDPALVNREEDGRLVPEVPIEGLGRKAGARSNAVGMGGVVSGIFELETSRF